MKSYINIPKANIFLFCQQIHLMINLVKTNATYIT